MSQDPQHKPKTTIIPANPGIYHDKRLVVAWVIEDGDIAKAITVNKQSHEPYGSCAGMHVQLKPAGSGHA